MRSQMCFLQSVRFTYVLGMILNHLIVLANMSVVACAYANLWSCVMRVHVSVCAYASLWSCVMRVHVSAFERDSALRMKVQHNQHVKDASVQTE